jgi:hypothetical protein
MKYPNVVELTKFFTIFAQQIVQFLDAHLEELNCSIPFLVDQKRQTSLRTFILKAIV